MATSVVENVLSELQQRIFGGVLAPGARLPSERNLSAELQVARAPVREALSRLDQLGLIDVQHGKASTVRDFWQEGGLEVLVPLLRFAPEHGPRMIRGMLEFRIMLGGDLAEMATERLSEEDRDWFTSYARQETPADRDALIEYDFALFDRMTRVSGNQVYAMLMNSVRSVYMENLDLLGSLVPDRDAVQAGHTSIVESLVAGDSHGARSATRRYLALGYESWVGEPYDVR